MKISYNWLNTYFKKGFLSKGLPKPEKLAELFNTHAFEVEGVEKKYGDTVLDIKVLPDRAHYALCHRGIAREASVVSGIKLVEQKIESIKINPSVIAPKVTIYNPNLCYRYTARRIDGLQVTEKSQFKKQLETVGARSINNVVDATNFVMLDIGQPLHAFDADKIVGGINVRLAKVDEKITLLDGREVSLLEADLVIADDVGPLAIAGVKGGKRAEVTLDTKSIILESANFNSTTVRRTSTRLNLRNDSSKRFENEITPMLAGEAMEKVTASIIDSSKGAIASAVVDIYPNPVKPWSVEIEPIYISSIIGSDVSNDEITNILCRLGCKVEKMDNKLNIIPPFDRLDLIIPEDIADEIGRIRGYEGLVAKQTPQVEVTPVDKTFYYSEKIKNILIAQGFSEVITYSLVPKGHFEINYPMSSDKSALREKLSSKLSEVMGLNISSSELLGLESVKIFEIGKVFPKEGEHTSLAIGLKKKKGKDDTLSQIATIRKYIFDLLGVEVEGYFDPKLGVWEVNLDVLISKLPNPTSTNDLNFTALSKDIKYKPFSHYPFIVRDIAFFAPKGTDEMKARTLIDNVVRAFSDNLLIKGPDMFDKFEKGEKVSFGFRMIFQSFERTLSDDEVNSIMELVYKAVKNNGWEVR
jgi:phenylalanyl-tRNA synthetase beta chain